MFYQRRSRFIGILVVLITLALLPGLTLAKDFKTVEPIQFSMGGQFPVGDTDMHEGVTHPQTFTIPDGASLLIRYVSCQALVDPGTTVFIHFITEHGEAPALSLIPTARSYFSTVQERIAATANTEIYLGIDPPVGPAIGNEIILYGQRETAVASALLSCTLSGELSMP